MSKVTVIQREVPRNVMNHKGRGDSRPALTTKGIEAYDGMTLDQVHAKAEAEFADNALKERGLDVSAALDIWIEKHPEYANVDDKTSKRNAEAIAEELGSPEGLAEMQRGGRLVQDARAPKGFVVLPNFWDIATAASRAEAKGKLTAHQGELYKQRRAAVEAQISLTPSEEDEAYSMDIHELRRRGTPGSYDPLGPQ